MNELRGPPRKTRIPPLDLSKLAGAEIEERDRSGVSMLPGRLERFGRAKARAVDFLHWARESGKIRSAAHKSAVGRLTRCGNYLGFSHYYTVDEVRLTSADFCKQHLICPLCAIRRGSKLMEAYIPKFEAIQLQYPALKPVFITLTVKNGSNLEKSVDLLRKSMAVLFSRRRDARTRCSAVATQFKHVAALVGTIEVTNKGNGWHPHAHMVVFVDQWIDQQALSKEWLEITGDSFVVGVQRLDSSAPPVDAFAEVFKYALKFSELKNCDIWTAYRTLRASRLVYSCGLFRKVAVIECLLDDALDDLPYVEWFYRYFNGIGYSL